MQILNWIPSHAQQIRFIAPYYDEDGDGDRYCVNEDEATDVYRTIIRQVHKTKRPMYYRRRTLDLARRDRFQWQRSIYSENNWRDNWINCLYVRVKVLGRRVLFIYDKEFVHKNWIANKKRIELQDKIRKLKERKLKNYDKKINILNQKAELMQKINEELNFGDDTFDSWIENEVRDHAR